MQIPGDVDGSAAVDLNDIILFLGFLVLGNPEELPCGDGSTKVGSNIELFDAEGSGIVDFTDGIHELKWLLLGGPGHVRGTECMPVPGCPESAAACR